MKFHKKKNSLLISKIAKFRENFGRRKMRSKHVFCAAPGAISITRSDSRATARCWERLGQWVGWYNFNATSDPSVIDETGTTVGWSGLELMLGCLRQ